MLMNFVYQMLYQLWQLQLISSNIPTLNQVSNAYNLDYNDVSLLFYVNSDDGKDSNNISLLMSVNIEHYNDISHNKIYMPIRLIPLAADTKGEESECG